MVQGQAQPRSSPRTIRRERTPISCTGTANREVHIPEISVCAGDSLATGQMGIQGSFRFIQVGYRREDCCEVCTFPSSPSLVASLTLRFYRSDAEIRANVYKSLVLNSLSLFSIYVFDLLLQPLVKDEQKWFHRNIGWFYQVLWLLPVVGSSLYLNVRLSINNPLDPHL